MRFARGRQEIGCQLKVALSKAVNGFEKYKRPVALNSAGSALASGHGLGSFRSHIHLRSCPCFTEMFLYYLSL